MKRDPCSSGDGVRRTAGVCLFGGSAKLGPLKTFTPHQSALSKCLFGVAQCRRYLLLALSCKVLVFSPRACVIFDISTLLLAPSYVVSFDILSSTRKANDVFSARECALGVCC